MDATQHLRKLRATLASMREVHQSHEQHAQRLVDDIASLQLRYSVNAPRPALSDPLVLLTPHHRPASVPKQEEELGLVSARYTFFQEIKMYLRDLLGCLDAKVCVCGGLSVCLSVCPSPSRSFVEKQRRA
jgi:hypothetical protein